MKLNHLLPALAWVAPALAQDNVLLVVLDDVGVDMLSGYAEGSIPARTPVIDALAQGGVLFRNVWANPCCSPTRATIQTGRYGMRTGIGMVISKKGHDLQLEEWILPEVLALGSHGHASAGFGKWHLTNQLSNPRLHPNLSGYEHWVGTWSNLNAPQSYDYWIRTENGVSRFTDVYATTETVDSFLEWHEDVDGPWFAYVAFHAAHEPFHAPPPHLHTVDLPPVEPRDDPVPFFRAAVEALDTELGRLLAELGDELDHTHVIVVGDNGTPGQVSVPPFEPGHAKLTPYEGGINVPLVISGPAVVQGGREVAALVNTTDLFTTVIEMAGERPSDLLPAGHVHDSISLVPYLAAPGQAPLREWVYSEMWKPNGGLDLVIDWRMLRDERYKVIRADDRFQDPEWFLFDLGNDPFEERNLFDQPGGLTPEQQRRFDALRGRLELVMRS